MEQPSLHRRLRGHLIDPLPRRLLRAAKVIKQKGMLGDIDFRRLRAARAIIQELGLGTRSAYALQAALHPDRPALVDNERRLTYGEADREINRLGNALRAHFGVRQRTPVVLMMENRVEYAIAWFALFRIGARAVHASYRQTAEELRYIIEHSGAKVVLCSAASAAAVVKLQLTAPELNVRALFVGAGAPAQLQAVAYADVVAAASDAFPTLENNDDFVNENIVYTSGTTGKPKGALRDFTSVNATEFFRLIERLPYRVGDNHLVVSPLYHSAGQAFTLMQTALGATIYFLPHFEPEGVLKAIHDWNIHSMFMVPTMIHRVVDLPDELWRRYPPRSFRCLVSGAAPFPHALRLKAIERFGADAVWDFYGATELGWVTLINGHEMIERPGSVGRAQPGQELRIMDEHGKVLGTGEVGLVYVRNEQTMVGYYKDDRATAATHRGEWITVEDLGYLDADGYLYLSGRSRDMVISGGVNIYPAEIEEVLVKHPSVQDAAVIGVPDAEWGERLVGVVVPTDAASFDASALQAYAREHLASLKVPKEWHIVDDLPRNPTGKVLKRELRERFARSNHN